MHTAENAQLSRLGSGRPLAGRSRGADVPVRIFSLFPVSTLAEFVISDRRAPVFNQLASDRRSAPVSALG